jgi:hypothetical protein
MHKNASPAPEGRLAIDVPLADSLQCQLFSRKWAVVTEAPRHLTIPSSRGMTALFARCPGVDLKTAKADSALANAGIAAFSILPLSAATFCQGSGRSLITNMQRVLSASATIAYPPTAYIEQMLGRPADMVFFAQKDT